MRHGWLVVVILFLMGCGGESSVWEETRHADTIDAYEAFLNEHPSGNHASEARARIATLSEERDWASARATHSRDAYHEYLSQHSDGHHAAEAHEWLGTASYVSTGSLGMSDIDALMSTGIGSVTRLGLSAEVRADGRRANIHVVIAAETGLLEVRRSKRTLYRSPDQGLAVSGALEYSDHSGKEIRIPIQEIYVPSNGDVVSGWFVLDDLRFGRTDVARLLKDQPLMSSRPNEEVDPGRKVTLLEVDGFALVP